jgi:hypothetical protein
MHRLGGAATAGTGWGGCALAWSVLETVGHDKIILQVIVLVTVDRQLSGLIPDVDGLVLEARWSLTGR